MNLNSYLNTTFYKHFFDDSPDVRERARIDLDATFTKLADEGASRYEITRQMICGIVNAQERFDAESERTDRQEQAARPGERAGASGQGSTGPAIHSSSPVNKPQFFLFACIVLVLIVVGYSYT